jgi:hypothetical protein
MAYIAFFAPEKQDIEKVSRHIKSYNGLFDPKNVNIDPISGGYFYLFKIITSK